MACASVAHEDRLLLYHVAALSMGSAWIDGMLVVEAPADRVAFDNLIAHVSADGVTMRMVGRGIRYRVWSIETEEGDASSGKCVSKWQV